VGNATIEVLRLFERELAVLAVALLVSIFLCGGCCGWVLHVR
jgi:hypothetical protein